MLVTVRPRPFGSHRSSAKTNDGSLRNDVRRVPVIEVLAASLFVVWLRKRVRDGPVVEGTSSSGEIREARRAKSTPKIHGLPMLFSYRRVPFKRFLLRFPSGHFHHDDAIVLCYQASSSTVLVPASLIHNNLSIPCTWLCYVSTA